MKLTNTKEEGKFMNSVLDIWQPWIDLWTPKPTTVAVPDPVQQKTAGTYCIETKYDMKSGVVTVRHEFGW